MQICRYIWWLASQLADLIPQLRIPLTAHRSMAPIGWLLFSIGLINCRVGWPA